ncbi:branched-chain amino acid aminotransferase [Actibacterium mucosum KCTC 23349]|uniref:Branched-chain amino acid aminotransferase n=1 Tax=Actibacterium mucosum KCTC 23349 TaxID=1454373 RepID=A0A037ZNY0_9RHOB|nr:branched chain amino acid aminotransferase [Actibacterium mucosum]KAJ57263.1 branched-chain amino acid aminotransferase [Actibacterium mucosum KCTC 23349]
MRIAMWSGPRNISTAMMYAFAARGDSAVWDEPFYAAYLTETGLHHPMHQEIIDDGECDPSRVAATCLGPVPGGKPLFYQKHMCQHMLPNVPRDWMAECQNVFLIRHPARVIASFAQKYENPTLQDIGFALQGELFDHVTHLTGQNPLVLDSVDIRANPAGIIQRLCDKLGIAFVPSMLSWPAGGHPDDGVWAPVWYGAVHQSTGFAAPEGPLPSLTGPLADLCAQALPVYERLREHALTS